MKSFGSCEIINKLVFLLIFTREPCVFFEVFKSREFKDSSKIKNINII